jgi:hypothetical protein
MMTSKERINRILDFQTPDRVGIKDLFWDETRRSWQRGLKVDLEDYFDFDIRALDIERPVEDRDLSEFFSPRNKDRFMAISFREPFQRYVDKVGLERALENIGKRPKAVFAEFKSGLDEILSKVISILDKGYKFDGLWLFGDLAHGQDIFFSPEFYEKYLFGFHREVCYFFASWGIPTILHSDGNISRIIPLLIKAGFRALHPVQYSAGLDIRDLKREYKRDVVFFGNFDIGILAYPREILETFLIERLDACKGDGGYIFGFDGPLGPDAKFEDYQFVLETVKAHGRY